MAKTIDKLDKSVQQTLDMSGYATTNHGTHVTFTSTVPKVAGTAAVGSATTVSRSDHVHPPQTTVSGNAGSATKLATARTLTIGNTGKAFDGSANVSWSLSDIGALPAAGGNVTGNIKVTNDSYLEWNRNTDYARISFKNTGDSDSDSYMYFLTGDNGNEYFKFSTLSGSTTTDLLTIKTDHLRFKGYNVYHTGNKPTLADIGAAASSHGTHVTYSSTSPKVAGTASVGSEGAVARGDHVHAAQTSVSGNAGSATKLATARNIVIGNKTNSFNGTANITYTLADIGAAASDHKHGLLHDNLTCTLANTTTDTGWSMINSSYNGFLLKSIRTNASAPNWICGDYSAGIAFGGADTKGVISTTYNSPSIRFAGGNGAKPVWWINLTGTSGTSYNLANFENKNHGTHVTYSTTTPKVAGTAAVGSAANVARGDHVHPAQTSVSGNAGTATKLATARTLTVGNTGKTFDGSANVSWSLSEIGAAASSHTHSNIINQDTRDVNTTPDGAPIGLSVHLKTNGKDGLSDGGTYHSSFFIKGWNDYSGGPYGNLAITANNNLWFRASSSGTAWNSWKKVSVDGHTHSYAGSGSAGGAANSATKLATARNIKLGGLLSGSASFNGTADATISASIAAPPKSGDWFSGGIPTVSTGGVMEIGKYIDFHNTDASTNDYDVRLQCNTSTPCVITLPTSTSTLATTAQIGTLSSLKTSAKGNLVAAINELFQSAGNAKDRLIEALAAEGIVNSTSDSFDAILNNLLPLVGKAKFVTGSKTCTVECDPAGNPNGTSVIQVATNLGFTPTYLFVKIEIIYLDSVTRFYNTFVTNLEPTILYFSSISATIKLDNISASSFKLYFESASYTEAHLTNLTWYALK